MRAFIAVACAARHTATAQTAIGTTYTSHMSMTPRSSPEVDAIAKAAPMSWTGVTVIAAGRSRMDVVEGTMGPTLSKGRKGSLLPRRVSLILAALALTFVNSSVSVAQSASLLSAVDHLVYATPDLDRGIREIEALLGVRATIGGQHPGRGTRNALIALGPRVYLEIIGPDPSQPPLPLPRAFGLDTLKVSRLVGWAAKTNSVDSVRNAAISHGVTLGEVKSGSRKRPDGVLLTWRFTDSGVTVGDGLVPFFIDWLQSPHPSESAAQGARLIALRAEHPDDVFVTRMLRALSLNLPISHGPRASLVAVIEGPRGRVELR